MCSRVADTRNQDGEHLYRLTQKIKMRAQELGLSKAGIARAVRLNGSFLDEWLSSSFHAGMAWITRSSEKRLDPGAFLPGARSVIAVALNYYARDPDRPHGSVQISRYAVGRDYHEVLREKLESLFSYICELIPGVRGKTAVDSAPVLDKVWAVCAGVGWIGRHSNVITRDFGSYIFLGELFLDCELFYDRAAASFCGNCTRCIEACPTGAITAPCVVDSRKCISYRTIEHRGDFPREWDAGIGDWVFGCDICQEVCPWNKFSRETAVPDFLPREGIRFPLLNDINKLTRKAFTEKFKGSPVMRTKYDGFMRNASHVNRSFQQRP